MVGVKLDEDQVFDLVRIRDIVVHGQRLDISDLFLDKVLIRCWQRQFQCRCSRAHPAHGAEDGLLVVVLQLVDPVDDVVLQVTVMVNTLDDGG